VAFKDPDVAAFREMWKKRAAARGKYTLAEQRVYFDNEMGAVPIAPGCTTTALTLAGVSAELIQHQAAVPGKILLYLHGGGYVFGSIRSHRHLVSRFAVAASVHAAHIDYRLAPEHPYPAQLEDASRAYKQLLSEGYPADSIIVGGESAGGNLAVALSLKLRDEGVPQPAGLYLLSPWLDMSTTSESYKTLSARDPILTAQGNVGAAVAFLGETADNSYTSPIRADLTGLPPLFIQVGTEEILLSDSTTFAGRAAIAGNDIRLHVWPEMPHVWPLLHFAIRAGLTAINEAGRWMQNRLRIGSKQVEHGSTDAREPVADGGVAWCYHDCVGSRADYQRAFSFRSGLPPHSCRGCCTSVDGERVPEGCM
jgi:acetyl esterase/lipase